MNRLILPILAICIMLLSFLSCNVPYFEDPQTSIDEPETAQQPAQPSPDVNNLPDDPPGKAEAPKGDFRAVWVATVINLDFPTSQGLSVAALKTEIEAIVATTVDMGLNAVVLQVRPSGDALYDSDIFPWSEVLSGEQGIGIDGFDPLAYWLEVCHENNVELHAWLNPYRIIHTLSNSSDPETLSPDNPVRQNPELAVSWQTSNGQEGLFLDPGLPEARQLIIDGIAEIIGKYDVDGIHFDDYFYPGTDFNDDATFAVYGNEMELGDWRRENVNTLIRDIQSIIYEHNETNEKNVRWGISPTAIWKNGSSDPLGIPTTNGNESYHAMYADTRRWVEEGWVDYICPQIYWYIGFEIADFEAIFNWWSELCSGTGVDLYIGHAAYREFEDNQPPNWQGEIVRQLEMVAASDIAKGSIFFRYFSMRSNVGKSVRSFYAETDYFPDREPLFILDTLSVGFPSPDAVVTGTPRTVSGHNITGTSIPDIPLYVNGEEVTNRTAEGFFHVFASLVQGDNLFTFTQEGQEDVTCVITLKPPESGGEPPSPKAKITNITTLDYVTVSSDNAWVYPSNTTAGGSTFMLSEGQRDRIIARSDNNLVKLSSGVWLLTNDLTETRENAAITNVLKDGTYRIEDDFDVLAWISDVYPAVITSYSEGKLTVSFGMHTEAPPLELPEDLEETMFKSSRSGTADGVPYYEFTLNEDARFEGCFTEHEEGELRIYLKKRKTITDGDKPLEGITIMLDPGHGGDSLGTTAGPFGENLPEKELVLTQAQMLSQRLEALGATVVLTRDDDTERSLHQRIAHSYDIRPDLFISLHINSNAETTNWEGIRGFTVWYHGDNSLPFAEETRDIMQFINPGTNRQKVANQNNLYVCLPWWAPHILFEASFFSSIEDYVWLLDEHEQHRYADRTADVILEYFK